MVQEIIVYIVVSVAVIIAVYKIVKAYRKPKDPCSGCGSDCAGCQFKDIPKKEKK